LAHDTFLKRYLATIGAVGGIGESGKVRRRADMRQDLRLLFRCGAAAPRVMPDGTGGV